MAAIQLAIHIPPEATPDNVTAMLQALVENQIEFANVDDLLQFMMELDIGTRTEVQSIAERMGLLNKQKNSITVSESGRLLIRLKLMIIPEVLHFLIYTGWHEKNPMEFLPAWAYRYICDYLWNNPEYRLSDEQVEQIISEIIVQAETNFEALELGEIAGVSFSAKSIRGARRWLDALTPAVIENNVFARRTFCPPELLLLAIGWVFRDEPDPIDVPLLLTRLQRDAICRLCLLDPKFFDRTLDWLLPRFPKVILSEDKAGFYGRSIRLRKLPSLADIIP